MQHSLFSQKKTPQLTRKFCEISDIVTKRKVKLTLTLSIYSESNMNWMLNAVGLYSVYKG